MAEKQDYSPEKPLENNTEPADKPEISMDFLPASFEVELTKSEQGEAQPYDLVKSITSLLNGGSEHKTIESLAFETDPSINNTYSGLYRQKLRLIPDVILKRIAIQDDLIAAIIQARSNMVSAFGRTLINRFDNGFSIEPKRGVTDRFSPEEKLDLKLRIDKSTKLMSSCGHTGGWDDEKRLNFSQYLYQSTRCVMIFGRIATEIIYSFNKDTGDYEFHSFRPRDAGTILQASPSSHDGSAAQVRNQAIQLLEQLKQKRLEPEKFKNDEYKWIQVIDGRPYQAFTAKEMLVHNFYPVTDIEMDGYPLTPIDTMIAAVTTHINITSHNKLYFQSGRASKGMIVIQSDDANAKIVQRIKQQFVASINSVSNSWRMPVFAVGQNDKLTWTPIDSGGRDMEFQYLSDSNARVILSAFQMSPDELPGYAHLCSSPDTQVLTNKGSTTIGSLLGDSSEVSGFQVWTGKGFCEARAFVTGKRPISKTTTSNGITLTTSPEHRFRIVGEDGAPTWREQKDLKVGDTVLVNRKPSIGFEVNVPSYHGKKLSVEMMEVLGWLTGDGSLQVNKRGKIKHSKSLEFFYNHEKEMNLRDRHFEILTNFGLSPKMVEKKRSQVAVDRQKSKFGFKQVASVRRSMALCNTEFVEFLFSIGFVPSTQEKAIPSFINSLPLNYRGSFLKGFFSADGSKDNLDTPSIVISNKETREQTKSLLLGMGIRTRLCEGTHKRIFVKKDNSDEFSPELIRASSKLIIKDKNEFYERIGFLQSWKQPSYANLTDSHRRWDKVCKSTSIKFANELLATDLVKGSVERDSVGHSLKDKTYPFCERSALIRLSEKYGFNYPAWIDDYYQETIVELESSEETMEMVDIEVFNDEHAFMANGILVHNSRGTNSQALSETDNSYKLEAARDVGINPLLKTFEDFLNSRILPLIDEKVAEYCTLRLVGLDSETPDKESTRLQTDMSIHMTMDEALERVQKKPLGAALGGTFLLNQAWQAVIDKYLKVGYIQEHLFGIAGASTNPEFDYVRDPYYFQNKQLQMQIQQMQQQAAHPQQGDPSQGGGSGGSDPSQGAQPAQGQDNGTPGPQDPNASPGQANNTSPDLSSSINQVQSALK